MEVVVDMVSQEEGEEGVGTVWWEEEGESSVVATREGDTLPTGVPARALFWAGQTNKVSKNLYIRAHKLNTLTYLKHPVAR